MKKFGIVLAAAMLAALCFAVVGCGSTDYTKNFTGTYKMTAVDANDGTGLIDSEKLSANNITVTMELKDDKTFKLDLMGQTMSGTWQAKDAKTISMDWDGTASSGIAGANDGTLDGSTLKLTDDSGAYMTFEKQ